MGNNMTHRELYLKNYYIKNCTVILKTSKEYRDSHKKERAVWYQKNKKKLLELMRIRRQKHKKEKALYEIQKRKEDSTYKLIHYLRCRIRLALNGNPKLSTSMNLVGCSIDELKHHLETRFYKGMTWENYGKWHVDHIKPCASFDLSKPEEQKLCFHYTNLQPLWAVDNLIKGKK